MTFNEFAISTTTGALGVYGSTVYLRPNNLYSPTSSGAQPRYFGTMYNIYINYLVHFADIQIRFSDPSGDGILCAVNFDGLDNFAFGGQSQRYVAEMPKTQVATLNNTGSQTVVFRQRTSMWALAGVSKGQYLCQTDVFGAQTGAGPTTSLNVYTAVADTNVGTGGLTAQIELRMTVRVQFFGLKNIAVS